MWRLCSVAGTVGSHRIGTIRSKAEDPERWLATAQLRLHAAAPEHGGQGRQANSRAVDATGISGRRATRAREARPPGRLAAHLQTSSVRDACGLEIAILIDVSLIWLSSRPKRRGGMQFGPECCIFSMTSGFLQMLPALRSRISVMRRTSTTHFGLRSQTIRNAGSSLALFATGPKRYSSRTR